MTRLSMAGCGINIFRGEKDLFIFQTEYGITLKLTAVCAMRNEKNRYRSHVRLLQRPIGGIETNILNGTEWRDGGKKCGHARLKKPMFNPQVKHK